MALDTDYTSPTYNSYYTIVEIDALVAALDGVRDVSKWPNQSDVQKESLILAATRDANTFCFPGDLSSAVKTNMAWPRRGAYYTNGVAIPENTIPKEMGDYIAYRVCERIDNQDGSASSAAQNIKRQKLGDLEQEFFQTTDGSSASTDVNDVPSADVIDPITCGAGGNGSTANVIQLVRA